MNFGIFKSMNIDKNLCINDLYYCLILGVEFVLLNWYCFGFRLGNLGSTMDSVHDRRSVSSHMAF